jgi:hypothetical protein
MPRQHQARTRERQRRVHLGEEQLPVAVPEPGPGVLGGLAAIAGLEPRISGALSKEVIERDLLVPDCLLEGDAGDFIEPVEVFAGFHGGQVSVGLGEVRLGVLVVVPGVPPRQGPVPHHADAAERTT